MPEGSSDSYLSAGPNKSVTCSVSETYSSLVPLMTVTTDLATASFLIKQADDFQVLPTTMRAVVGLSVGIREGDGGIPPHSQLLQ